MKTTYYIGDAKPWRFSKERAAKLMEAVIVCGARISASVDSTCPHIHALFVVEIDSSLKTGFQNISGVTLEIPPKAGGAQAF